MTEIYNIKDLIRSHPYLNQLTELIGSGANGHVYSHPEDENLAIKVSYQDKAYAAYMSWCCTHQGNPYIPKIVGHQSSTYDPGRPLLHYETVDDFIYTVTIMEHLTQYDQVLGKKLSDEQFAGKVGLFDDHAWVCKYRRFSYIGIEQFTDRHLTEVADWLGESGFCLDIGRYNIMCRGKQLVFTDPVC